MYIRTVLCLIFLVLSVAMFFTFPTQHSLSSHYIFNYPDLPHDCFPDVTPQATSTPTTTLPQTDHVVLNEILLQSQKPAYHCTDVSQETSPWIELYNPLHQATALPDAYILIQTTATPFSLPASTTIPAQGFSVLFLPTITSVINVTTRVQLFNNGELIDQITVPPLAVDTSYARFPDGDAWYVTLSPTINAANILTTSIQKKPTPRSTRTPAKHSKSHTKNAKQRTSSPHSQKQASSITGKLPSTISSATPTVMPQQPLWKNFHFTVPMKNNSITSNTVQPHPHHTVSFRSSLEISQKILITALLAALLLSLGWCMRLFFLT